MRAHQYHPTTWLALTLYVLSGLISPHLSFAKEAKHVSEEQALMEPTLSALRENNEAREAFGRYLVAMYDHRATGMVHRTKVYEWQFLSSKIIFAVVLILVATGVYFAAIQFHLGIRAKNRKSQNDAEERSEIEASLTGIKVSSPVLGVIILTLSLAFLYLYLIFVYPIEELPL
jgi:hypothetical protein